VSGPHVEVDTAQVRLSADQMDVVANEAATSRDAVAGSVAGQESAWKSAGRPGFAKFVGILEDQAQRLRTDLTGLAGALRAAADVYERQDQEGGSALDASVRSR
jgi:WXG100 family type VII secretion target